MSGSAPAQAAPAKESFLHRLEGDVEGAVGFMGREIVSAEKFFGSGTGPKKLETVLAAVTTGFSLLGWNVGGATAEATAVINALVGLFNKVSGA